MRKKNRAERERLTFFFSLVITLAIALVWVTAIFPRTINPEGSEAVQANTLTPFKSFSQDAKVVFEDAKQGIVKIQESVSGLFVGTIETSNNDSGEVTEIIRNEGVNESYNYTAPANSEGRFPADSEGEVGNTAPAE